MNIRKGDNVVILAGKDRAKKGKILAVLKIIGRTGQPRDRVVVEGLNMGKKHQKARKQGQKGQIISKERAMDSSNVQIVCPKCSLPTRVGHQLVNGPDASVGASKLRICKKCGAEL